MNKWSWTCRRPSPLQNYWPMFTHANRAVYIMQNISSVTKVYSGLSSKQQYSSVVFCVSFKLGWAELVACLWCTSDGIRDLVHLYTLSNLWDIKFDSMSKYIELDVLYVNCTHFLDQSLLAYSWPFEILYTQSKLSQFTVQVDAKGHLLQNA